jgi:toxin ParE1/3/4
VAEYRLSPRAEDDLRHIWRTIAHDNERAADRLLLRIFDRLEAAAKYPHIGPARPELGPTARILIEGVYVVIYEPMPYGVMAVAIVHGMRDPEQWLR